MVRVLVLKKKGVVLKKQGFGEARKKKEISIELS